MSMDEPPKISGISSALSAMRALKDVPKPQKSSYVPKKPKKYQQKIQEKAYRPVKTTMVPRGTSAILIPKPPKLPKKPPRETPMSATDQAKLKLLEDRHSMASGIPKTAPAAAQQKVLAQRILARRRLMQFTKLTHPKYDPGWVHADICARLERFSTDVAAGKSPRLLLLCPPRHGKSEIASIRFPAWHLGHFPDHELINVGYNLELPMTFSRKVRDLMRTPHYAAMFPDTVLDPESQAVEKWMTTRGGGYLAAGVGGGITGKGAHILIVDDPIKNQEEADSAGTREKLWAWYQSTAYTRLAPGGGVLCIETWWHDDDLAGRLQNAHKTDELADKFEVVKYPAISEAFEYRVWPSMEIIRLPTAAVDDAHIMSESSMPDQEVDRTELIRPINAPLHAGRYPLEALERIKANLHPRIWSALYQQNPVPDEGLYFRKEYFKYVAQIPDFKPGGQLFTAWDFAIATKEHNDWTVGVTLYRDDADICYVVDVFRIKADTFVMVEAMLDVAQRFTAAAPSCDYKLCVEDGQIWKTMKPVLDRRMHERREYVSHDVMKPLTDKMTRARPLQGRMQQGRLYWPTPEKYAWVDQAVQEMLRFPGGVHDDVVDALAWAARAVTLRAPPNKPAPVLMRSWRDKLSGLGRTHGAGHMSA